MEIREARIEDAAALLDIYRPYVEKTAISFEWEVPSLEEFTSRIENTLKRFPYLVAVIGDEIVGYAYVSSFKDRAAYDWCVETSIYVKEGMTHKGIGKALHQVLEERVKLIGILNMYACIACTKEEDEYLDNNSVEFHQHMGYRIVGTFNKCGLKFGRWYDMVWMERLIGMH